TGSTSQRAFTGVSFIQGFTEDGSCIGAPISQPLVVPIEGAEAFIQANCAAEPQELEFKFCNIDEEAGIPVDEVRGAFPPGTLFYNGPDPQNALEYNNN